MFPFRAMAYRYFKGPGDGFSGGAANYTDAANYAGIPA